MRDIYKNYHTEVMEGFTVELRFEDECLRPEEIMDDRQDIEEIYKGDLTWLMAVVEVSKCGIELGSAVMGGITYHWNDLENFIKDRFYDMAHDAITEAKSKLIELQAA